jgi:hypothetical protein
MDEGVDDGGGDGDDYDESRCRSLQDLSCGGYICMPF